MPGLPRTPGAVRISTVADSLRTCAGTGILLIADHPQRALCNPIERDEPAPHCEAPVQCLIITSTFQRRVETDGRADRQLGRWPEVEDDVLR